MNHPERDGQDVVDCFVRESAHDVLAKLDGALLLLTCWVAAGPHSMDNDPDELLKTRVKPGQEAIGEQSLRRVGSSSGSRMVSGVF